MGLPEEEMLVDTCAGVMGSYTAGIFRTDSLCMSVDLLVISVHAGMIVIVCVILSVDPLARS